MATTSVGAVSMDLTLDSKKYTKQLNSVTKTARRNLFLTFGTAQ